MQIVFDVFFLIKGKNCKRLKDEIEWPLYAYYSLHMISQLPIALHIIVDLFRKTFKFPFVFPIFIQLNFTSKVWLNVVEMTLLFVCYSSDLYIWILFDKKIRWLIVCWLKKVF